jgi:murein DD-endopeptidase MepM/ murein hydrolase activator NlpD
LTNTLRVRSCALALMAFAAAFPATAFADGEPTGGTAAPGRPDVDQAQCATGQQWACGPGQRLVLRGEQLRGVGRVLFLGRSGRRDDRAARPLAASPHRVVLTVPSGARTGPLALRAALGHVATSPRRLRIVPATTTTGDAAPPGTAIVAGGRKLATFAFPPTPGAAVEAVRSSDGEVVRSWPADEGSEVRWDGTVDGVAVTDGQYVLRLGAQQSAPFTVHDAIFPIRGKHDLGQSAANNFGGGRGHQGQDMFATCGTPLVAVRAGRVQFAAAQSRAGNYVVLQSADGQSYAYMHMRDAALVNKGDVVYAGQRVGFVGQTGQATGCHLHFELWTAPGWYTGGHAVDPLPELTRWNAFDAQLGG